MNGPMVNGPVRLELADSVAVVTVDNPPVNALSDPVLVGLERAALEVAAATDVRAVVLAGAGEKAFLAGADIEELRSAHGDPAWLERHTTGVRRTLKLWEALRQPVVAAVQASAIGGGLEVLLICDLVVADPTARFGLPEVSLGLIPGAGGTQRLPRRIPVAVAKEMLLLGRLLDADEAKAYGLVNRIAAPGAARAEACELAARIAAMPAVASQAAKQAVDAAWTGDVAEGLDVERRLFFATFASEDAGEGVDAFLEKRTPRFVHR